MSTMVAVETKTNLPLHPPLVRKPTVAVAAGAAGDGGRTRSGAQSSRGAVGVPINGEGASRCSEKVFLNRLQQLPFRTVPGSPSGPRLDGLAAVGRRVHHLEVRRAGVCPEVLRRCQIHPVTSARVRMRLVVAVGKQHVEVCSLRDERCYAQCHAGHRQRYAGTHGGHRPGQARDGGALSHRRASRRPCVRAHP
jgi:hypothetical protein